MQIHKNEKSRTVLFAACAVICAASPTIAAPPPQSGDTAVYLKDVERFEPLYLAQTRQNCAEGKMPAILRKIADDKQLQVFHSQLPDVQTYCLKVLSVSKTQGRMLDMYINIALQEQGYDSFDSYGQATLLKNHETARTVESILRAANAGQANYVSITGQSRNLPCPLALDVGATWANGNSSAQLPIELTQQEAHMIAQQCYDPAITTITLRSVTYPAQKAGLMAGVWLAKGGQ